MNPNILFINKYNKKIKYSFFKYFFKSKKSMSFSELKIKNYTCMFFNFLITFCNKILFSLF